MYKFLILVNLLILMNPTKSRAQANCEQYLKSIETCTPSLCEREVQSLKIKMKYEIMGFKDNLCIILMDAPIQANNSNMGATCTLKKEALKTYAVIEKLTSKTFDLQLKTSDPETLKSPEILEGLLKEMTSISEKVLVENKKLILENGNIVPCKEKDARVSEKFRELSKSLQEAVKPLESQTSIFDKNSFNETFNTDESVCLATYKIGMSSIFKRMEGVQNREACQTLKQSLCSGIMKRANIERVSCPIEISLFYSKPDKTSLTSQNETMAIFICEPNGIVREKNKLTYDKELSNSKNNFCIKNQDYLCRASIYSNDGVVLDAATKIIKTRIGAELECLRIARRLASPFCKDAKTDLTAGISLGVSDRLDPAAILLNENFKNFCKTQTLKKIFN